MPWKEVSMLDQRMKFVTAYREGDWPLTVLCRAYGISRKTGYKFLARFARDGVLGLADRSRAPHAHPNTLAPGLAATLLATRRAHPSWGPRKLRAFLVRRHPTVAWPAASTISTLVRRAGLALPRRRRRHAVRLGTPLIAPTVPNAVWTADFKGWIRARNGQRCDPLTIVDAASRYLLACELVAKMDGPHVRAAFERTFRTYGLPQALHTDNGAPFAATSAGGLTRLGAWWVKLGIVLQRSRPGRPQENGRHERVHLTLHQTIAQPPQATRAAQQRACIAFRNEYNHERPHAALDDRTPADVYVPSPRPYPAQEPVLDYPPRYEIRRIDRRGHLRWHGDRLFLSEALFGEFVGLRPLSEDHWAVCFGPLELAAINDRTGKLLRYKTVRYTVAPAAEV